ncbi:hypothetical protein GCK72_019973 [Caenorhabditis remanei]|uniref:BAAT/Acyl-CoA thioester hydrolase C-terminal domain-containing protein n=1 Tax=Caenorhabditis remanei TaxID=31234 RepID=A0A6A5GFD6_CAERE|nr:hypothetical protein GCK72_019973 [Caenorhabditis remanei]KAF1753416.1 hypothetical protein GCK72_019973 [Caenorhabditis remanei]
MGLFLSVQFTDELSFGHLVMNENAEPFFYTLRLISESEEILDEVNMKKHWTHPLVTQITVSQDGLYGTIFKPPGPGPFPCIIDIPGINGRISKRHSAVFSSEGFLVYTFAAFDYKDLPKKLQDVDIELYSRHIKFVQSLPYCSNKIALYGLSLSGTIANYLSTKHSELSAVVSVNGPEAFYRPMAEFKENGKAMNCEEFDGNLSEKINGVIKQKRAFLDAFSRLKPETSIKWEQISKKIQFRLVGSMDDWIICGVTNCLHIRDNLLKTGHKVEIDLVAAGHTMLVPYCPHQALAYNKFHKICLGSGGETTLNNKSGEQVWNNHLKFFKRHLGTPVKMPDYKRKAVIELPRKVISKL